MGRLLYWVPTLCKLAIPPRVPKWQPVAGSLSSCLLVWADNEGVQQVLAGRPEVWVALVGIGAVRRVVRDLDATEFDVGCRQLEEDIRVPDVRDGLKSLAGRREIFA